jgi:D-arabinose 1-dehydrogenase-like Zn-dependent alcohol dehydrogenase
VLAALHAAHPEGVDAVLDLVNGSDVISRDAEILKSGGTLVSTIHAADEKWFAERHITAYNIGPSSIPGPGANPSSSPQGLSAVARMAAEGTITVRIGSTVALEGAGQMLEKLRSGGLHGKAVIRI